MAQSKLFSLLESGANIAVGVLVAFASQLLIFPFFNIHVSLTANVQITLWFTLISFIRGYALRRLFNRKS